MNEKQRDESEKSGPRSVKVTDRRRVSIDKGESADASSARMAGDEAKVRGSGSSEASEASNAEAREGSAASESHRRGGQSEGSSTSEASGRSAAPLATDAPGGARDETAELREHLQRMAADFDNYRKRVLKEQTRAVEMAAEPLIRRLLEVLDEFDLALIAAEQKPDFDKFLHGVELVYAKLLETLRGEGLEKIEADGKPFDPSVHEALMQTGEAEGDPFVADVLRPGYTLRGRVIRPAGVKVVRK
ncbi:MAG: nucleotide exchange factor GrpE [Actinomycetota bacterium]|nr:nucleotide exchange factor GrpE [Actinomycetota bacterium]